MFKTLEHAGIPECFTQCIKYKTTTNVLHNILWRDV